MSNNISIHTIETFQSNVMNVWHFVTGYTLLTSNTILLSKGKDYRYCSCDRFFFQSRWLGWNFSMQSDPCQMLTFSAWNERFSLQKVHETWRWRHSVSKCWASRERFTFCLHWSCTHCIKEWLQQLKWSCNEIRNKIYMSISIRIAAWC